MINRFLFSLLVTNLFVAQLTFAINMTMPTNSTVNGTEYPEFYMNADGSVNVFTTYVAFLNYFGPLWNRSWVSYGYAKATQWNEEGNRYVADRLSGLGEVHQEIRNLISDVVQGFDNGIEFKTENEIFLLQTITNLASLGCESCLKEFTKIVSLRTNEDEDRKANLEKFKEFVEKIHVRNKTFKKCEDHKFGASSILVDEESDENSDSNMESDRQDEWISEGYLEWIKNGVKNAFWRAKTIFIDEWAHPFHISALSYDAGVLASPFILRPALDGNSLAGSNWGDYANLSNAIVIPSLILWNIFREWMNRDYVKMAKLAEAFAQRFEDVYIKFAGEILGTIDNGIDATRARGFLKAIFLIEKDTPERKILLQGFAQLAQNAKSVATDYQPLAQDILKALKLKQIAYSHEDIRLALSLAESANSVKNSDKENPEVQDAVQNPTDIKSISEQVNSRQNDLRKLVIE